MIRSRDKGPRLLCFALIFGYLSLYPWLVSEVPERVVVQKVIEEHQTLRIIYSESVQQYTTHNPFTY